MSNLRRSIKPYIRLIKTGLIAAFLLLVFSSTAKADQAVISVKASGGGTVKISAIGEAPAPDKTSVTLKDKETGYFKITCEVPGTYRYRIWEDDGAGTSGGNNAYIASVFVEQKDDKSITSYVTMAKEGSSSKSETAVFGSSREKKKSTEGNSSSKEGSSRTGTGSVQTGDTTPFMKWIVISLLSLSVMLAISITAIKRNRRKNG